MSQPRALPQIAQGDNPTDSPDALVEPSSAMRTKVNYREGDWFGVALRDGGFGLGIVARANPGGVLLGYFFSPKHSELPLLREAGGLTAPGAVLVRRFGHLGLVQGKWPILGKLDGWDRDEWPMPIFGRYESLTGRSLRVIYDANDPNMVVREEVTSADELKGLPTDALFGAGALEIVLTKLLR